MKKIHVAGLAAGAVMIAVGFGADQMGLGPVPGIGYKQTALLVVGAVVIVVSLYFGLRKEKP